MQAGGTQRPTVAGALGKQEPEGNAAQMGEMPAGIAQRHLDQEQDRILLTVLLLILFQLTLKT